MLAQNACYLGCDPELFIQKEGQIVGSERVVPEKPDPRQERTVVRDGVQVELQPRPDTCRESVAYWIQHAFFQLKRYLDANPGTSPVFNTVVEVSQVELDALSEKSRILGCAPSNNQHDPSTSINVNPTTYLKRSAGGHIHMGLDKGALFDNREKIVPILDILLGSICVLMDRDPDAAERRKVYGRAGEYRLPAHGLEYRTLSNFWLRSYPLMSFVLGMARMAVSVVYTDLNAGKDKTIYDWSQKTLVHERDNWDLYQVKVPAGQNLQAELMSLIDIKQVIKAITLNDLDLAWDNYQRIKPWIQEHVTNGSIGDNAWPLNSHNLDAFEFFLTKPIEEWFPTDPMEHWTKLVIAEAGWEVFLDHKVRPEMRMAERAVDLAKLVIAGQPAGEGVSING